MAAAKRFNLTEREIVTVALLVRGYQTKQIADAMGLSCFTVQHRLARMRRKTCSETTYGMLGLLLN